MNFGHQVIDLVLRGTHFDGRIQQTGGAHDLFYYHTLCFFHFIVAGSCADKDHLIDQGLKFFETLGPIVDGRGKPETVIYQHLFAGPVTSPHPSDLWEGYVAFVDNHQKIIWEVIDQAKRTSPWGSAIEKAGVVFDATTIAQLLYHFQIKGGALSNSIGFKAFAFLPEVFFLRRHFILNFSNDLVQPVLWGNIQIGREDGCLIKRANPFPSFFINGFNAFNFIPPKNHPKAPISIG